MLQSTSRQYVCWKCLKSSAHLRPAVKRNSCSFRSSGPSLNGLSQTGRRSLATVQHGSNRDRADVPDWPEYSVKSTLRDRLREWEALNRGPTSSLLRDSAPDEWGVENILTRPGRLSFGVSSDEAPPGSEPQESRIMFDGDDLMDVRGTTSALLAGDMVETSYNGNRLPVLAICLGRHHGLQYFYMSTGDMVWEHNIPTLFTVVNFVDKAQLQPLVDLIPEVPFAEPRNVFHHMHTPSALDRAAQLQRMMADFSVEAVSLYQSELKTLDQASKVVGDPVRPKYFSLEELADMLMPEILKNDNKFSAVALYAVHMALQRDKRGFRPLNLKWHRRNYMYEVQPISDAQVLQKVESLAHELVEAAGLRDNPSASRSLLEINTLGKFILKARRAIEASRQRREWTPHGMIGPSIDKNSAHEDWKGDDLEFIRFIELWACYRVVPSASSLESIASTILRLTGMYTESFWLGHWTGVTFLQEIGWIPPWDIPARYEYRFPDTQVSRGGGLVRQEIKTEESLRPDIAADMRRDWGDLKVYCVDSAQTADVDDGFSIEQTDKPGEYWIHVHIADPASCIDPTSHLAKYLERVPSSLYLAGYHEKMLPPALEQRFSLNPGQVTLTFSALVNQTGDILDYKVEPGTIHNVVHMTKEGVSSILPGLQTPSKSGEYFAVGKEPSPPLPVKHTTTADDLSPQDKEDLLLLNRLCEALRDRRAERGQLPTLQPHSSSPEVSFHATEKEQASPMPNGTLLWHGDPYIKVSRSTYGEADRLVERLMHTAGEVAARWCQARKIPVPFSTQPDAVRNAGELAQLRHEVIQPLVADGKELPMGVLQKLFSLIGTSELSSRAAPFYSVGVDAYAKSSSPLRRFGDLLVHWQIHAALAQERATGQSLEGTDCSEADFLPWTRKDMDKTLPILQARQRQIKQVDNGDGSKQWIAQALVRAWRFGEAPLPKTFTFVVNSVYADFIRGSLSSFYGMAASLDVVNLAGIARLADIEANDLFEVEIVDMNVVTLRIVVHALRRVKSGDGEAAVETSSRVEDLKEEPPLLT